METDKLRISDCPLCNYFKSLPEDIKLYYPQKREDVPNSEFIVIDCKECGMPVVIYGEHVSEITKEAYGKILYKCRMLFGNDVVLKDKHKIVDDHFSLHKVNRF